MRNPSRPSVQDSKGSNTDAVGRDPSYPDRQRIDSDVRAFMRPVSTPWITFDRESRVDFGKVAIRAGVGFESTPDFRKSTMELPQVLNAPGSPTAASRLAETNAMFPPSMPNQKAAEDPSSLIVAKDVVGDEPVAEVAAPKKSRMGYWAMTAGIVGIAAGAAFAFTHQPAPMEGVGTLAAAPKLAPAPPPAVEAPPAPAPEPAPAPAATVAEEVGEKATDPKKRFGHLVIKGDATKKQVWFDSKRMLGKGDRSFLVFCGMHQMAITDGSTTRVTADTLAKDVEVPCSGELVVGK